MLKHAMMATHIMPRAMVVIPCRFRGKTEPLHKFKTPKLKMHFTRPIYPPPGYNLQIPPDMTPQKFCRQIGGDCEEYAAEKFENIQEIFSMNGPKMKERGVPIHQRKYILRCVELLRRGLLTFEYLNRRTELDPVKGR